jgi:hypothetical protein
VEEIKEWHKFRVIKQKGKKGLSSFTSPLLAQQWLQRLSTCRTEKWVRPWYDLGTTLVGPRNDLGRA